jgi:type I restriction enzyme S subunit
VASVIRGVSFDKQDASDKPQHGYLPILRAGNIGDVLDTDHDLVWVPETRITEEQRLLPYDVAICMSSGSPQVVGKTAQLNKEWRGSVGAFCAIIRFRAVNPCFGALFLQSRAFFAWRNGQAKGANIQNLRKTELEHLLVPVPPPKEQERIARILDEANQLRRLRTEADRRTASFIPALFHDLFNKNKATRGKWPTGSLKSFGVAVRYGLGQPPEEDPDGIPLIRATNIKHGSIELQGLIRVKKDGVPTGRNPFLQTGEVLVVRSGAYTGDVGRVSSEWAGAVAGYDLVLTPSERVDSHFLTWFLLSPAIQNNYFANEKNRAAQPHLNATQVESTPCILPPLTLQREFSSYVEEVRALQLQQASDRLRLTDLFQSLLYSAFQGDL